jgi:hypothetical protein
MTILKKDMSFSASSLERNFDDKIVKPMLYAKLATKTKFFTFSSICLLIICL